MSNDKKIRSLRGVTRVPVRFQNKTRRKVDLFWLDYRGNSIRYQKDMPPGCLYNVDTFETHPWIAKDSCTGSQLVVELQPVYYPKAPADGSDTVQLVPITVPVFKLVDRCLDALRSLGVHKNPDYLHLPNSLVSELKTDVSTTCKEYERQRRT